MTTSDGPAKGRAPKAERTPIFERLQPFAPWDERAAPNLLTTEESSDRAGRLAGASDSLATALDQIASNEGAPASTRDALRHIATVAQWHASVWRDRLGGAGRGDGALDGLSEQAAARQDPAESMAVLARVAVPRLLTEAVLLRAELGDEPGMDSARWFSLLIDDLESARAELELMVQSQIGPGDGPRLADACAEVTKTVC